MKINQKITKDINAKVLKIMAKCSDCFSVLESDDGDLLCDYNGYALDFFPVDHYGGYIILHIDIDTGQILNWKQPTAREVEAFIAQALGAEPS